jgi:hypothetical protein
MPIYKIIQGSFSEHDGCVKGPGETIELSEAFAADHEHEVVLIDASEEQPADDVHPGD